jgi:cysteinyl-tRNA synthetase
MLTVNGQNMSKSLGNSFLPHELFTGNHKLLEKGYSPMTVRFFVLQAHYRSTLDFGNEALQAAEKGFTRLMNAVKLMDGVPVSNSSTSDIPTLVANVYAAMNDDFNTPIALSHLFEGVRIINSVNDKKETLSQDDKTLLTKLFNDFVFDILGLKEENEVNTDKIDGLMNMILDVRTDAKAKKDFTTSDLIRDKLKEIGFEIKDGKEGTSYTIN